MSEWMWPEDRTALERASGKWWVFLVLGIASVVLGLFLLFDIFTAVRTVALLAAFGLIATGLDELISAGRYHSALGMVAGLVLVVAGILAAAWPGITLWVLAVVTGVGLVVSGVARIAGAWALRVGGWGWLLAGGVVSAVVGLLALLWPTATILVLGVLLGVRMLVFGIAEIAFATTVREVHQAL